MKILYFLIRPLEIIWDFLVDLLNNNPRILLMKFLAICFCVLCFFISHRYKFENWYSVVGFSVSGVLSFLFACFSYMEDKEITFAKIKDITNTAIDSYKKIKEENK